MLRRQRVSRIFYGGAFYDYPLSLNAKTLATLGLGQACEVACLYLASAVCKLPETSLENFYINRFGRKLYSMFFEGYTEKLRGRHPRVISADWGSQRVKGLSISTLLADMLHKTADDSANKQTSLIRSFLYPKLGLGELWEHAAAEFERRGGRLVEGRRVTGISFDQNGKITSVTCEDATGSSAAFTATSWCRPCR